jgi:hypothetical protein
MHRWEDFNYLYFQISPSCHSIGVFIPVGLSLLLHLLKVLLGVEVSTVKTVNKGDSKF